jgi:hypothetical protein
MAIKAQAFIESFEWCRGVKNSYFGFGVGGIVGVFYFSIIPANEDIDRYLWVVVGDLPPAYLVTDEIRTPGEALRAYIYEMRQWIEAVENGQSIEECIPVNAPANPEMASQLKSRVSFIEKKILPLTKPV